MKIEQKKSVLVYLTLHDGNVELLSPFCVHYSLYQKLFQQLAQGASQVTGTCFIKKMYALPLPYFKVNICPFPLLHFSSIFFAYL